MKVVIDTSVVMSAVMSAHGRVADVLLNPIFEFERFSCYFMPVEIFKHKHKLLKFSKLNEPDLLDSLYSTLQNIHLINESLISEKSWIDTEKLTSPVDNKDISFVALSLHLNAALWTLDKKLAIHLKNNDFQHVFNTQELIDFLTKS